MKTLESIQKLTSKQQMFCREYLVDINATQAAIRAGYSAKTADVAGPRLLGNVRVAECINGEYLALRRFFETAIQTH